MDLNRWTALTVGVALFTVFITAAIVSTAGAQGAADVQCPAPPKTKMEIMV